MIQQTSSCNVCRRPLEAPVYRSDRSTSLTSLCELRPGVTEIYFCTGCGHLQTAELASLQDYYAEDYKILLDSDEEDQLYEISEGKIVYRNEHQIQTLLSKIELTPQARVLDYGCAKGAAMRRLLELRPDVDGHLFDVSPMYKPFWRRFRLPDHWAVGSAPHHWDHCYDLIMSFFVLEHVTGLTQSLTQVRRWLKPTGLFYFVVPNVYANLCDFIVSDHVNHFSVPSLETCLHRAGLKVVEIDETSHESAFVVTAGVAAQQDISDQVSSELFSPSRIAPLQQQVTAMAHFWQQAVRGVQEFELHHAQVDRAAIYGSGFYGSFIASCLRRLDKVDCFLDRNPYRHGKSLFGKPVIPPDTLHRECGAIYVGLNPRIARAAIASVDGWQGRKHSYFFFDGAAAGC